MRDTRTTPDWNLLFDDMQLLLSREALRHAADTIAEQAETLEMETDRIQDRGGPDALRLLAAVIRIAGRDAFVPAGNA
ncbi:MAG TPA: hypothetical protein VGH36_14770 [Acetobacteraceae bacterium]